MLIYYGKRFDSASVGVRLVEVACDQCGCAYLYELARVGTGAASAPYAIGSAGAAKSAAGQAQRDRDRRLAEEAELVPCPKCHWVNEGLIAGYRRGRHRRWARGAAGLAIAGVSLSLVVAWFLSIGAAPDRGARDAFLIGGPAVSLAVAGALLLLRNLLRWRIRPNRDYPLPPKLPPGTPIALIRNPETGAPEPARGPHEKDDRAGGWIDFQVGRNQLPPVCCDCLAPTGWRSAYRRAVGPAVNVVVPVCDPCARRWTRRKWLGALATLGLAAAVGIPALLALKVNEDFFWLAVGSLGCLLPIIGAMVAGHVTSPVRVKVVDGSRGVARLRFRNEKFPTMVAADQGGRT